MGVRGLTSYIAKNAERYLQPFELHDTALVIDGDSLASNLYQWTPQCNSAYGGDYDIYVRAVQRFFAALAQCNVRPYVLMDGGYQRKKLRTVRERLRAKIGAVRRIDPTESFQLFPLHMREVFCETIRADGIPLMRCVLEADDEVAMLARRLNCPVLSYDSDFYIHNVRYIPSVTLSWTKLLQRKAPRRNRRKPSETSAAARAAFRPYKYLDCCVYTIRNLVGGGRGVSNEVLPLFATLLGNDYIKSFVFRKFYANLSKKNIGKRNSHQQRRIIALLRWLRGETLETALLKVLDRVEKKQRDWLAGAIAESMAGYTREDSKAFEYFGLGADDVCVGAAADDDDDDEEEISEDDEEDDDEDEVDDEEEKSDDDEEDDDEYNSTNCSGDEEAAKRNPAIIVEENTQKEEFTLPDWLLEASLAARLPRYITDLLFLKMYINSPQVENFGLVESNAVALPILRYIFTLIHEPNRPKFQYLTRMTKGSNVHFETIECIDETLQHGRRFDFIFDDFSKKTKIFEMANSLPSHFRLYSLAIVYWAERSKLVRPIHVHAVIICMCILAEVDRLLRPAIRCEQELQRKCKNLQTKCSSPSSIDTDAVASAKSIDSLRAELNELESMRLLQNVIAHFRIHPRTRTKHTEYSSTTVHTFAELQAIMFQMNALNAVLDSPYESISVGHFFNGTFLYNQSMALQDRADIGHYVRQFVFGDCCKRFGAFYDGVLAELQRVLTCLGGVVTVTRKMTRNRRKRTKKLLVGKSIEIVAKQPENELSSDDENECSFNDVNNQFAALRV